MFENLRRDIHKLIVGFVLRCPNCEQGLIFTGLFKMNKTCPNCGVRFERLDGESIGGMFINLGVVELLSVGGYFLFQALFNPPFSFQLVFWIAFNLIFVVLFYRHSRALWIAISYLTNGVYRDPDFKPSGPRPPDSH